jgi:hypothetical protein
MDAVQKKLTVQVYPNGMPVATYPREDNLPHVVQHTVDQILGEDGKMQDRCAQCLVNAGIWKVETLNIADMKIKRRRGSGGGGEGVGVCGGGGGGGSSSSSGGGLPPAPPPAPPGHVDWRIAHMVEDGKGGLKYPCPFREMGCNIVFRQGADANKHADGACPFSDQTAPAPMRS